jgi:predicted  nucleic acid-binding Zn-ribbon protein
MSTTTMPTKRSEYTAKMKQELDTLNARMDALQAKAGQAKAEARQKYNSEMSKLRHQSTLARTKLEEISVAGEEGWDKLMAEMEKLRDAFVHSFRYFKSQI